MDEQLTLTITLDLGPEAGDARLDEATRQMIRDLTALGGRAEIARGQGAPPDGALSVEAVTLGVLALAAVSQVLPAMINYLAQWQAARTGRSVTIERTTPAGDSIKVSVPENVSRERLQELIDQVTNELPAE